MKDNVEGKEFSPSFFVGEHQINEKEVDFFHDEKVPFGSYPKEECKSDLKSSFELPTEVVDNPPPTGCELGNMKEENLMKREEHSSEFCTLLQQDEVAATSEVRIEIGENSHPPIIIEES